MPWNRSSVESSLPANSVLTCVLSLPQLVGAIVKKLGIHDEPLPQDLTEGVDEDEWVS